MDNIEIGDRFTIDWNYIKKTYSSINICKYLDRIFTITDFSKSRLSVYFYDYKTNNSCKCNLCSANSNRKSISIREIKIFETKTQYERDKKLSKLLNTKNI
jgi:hypothetical protein